MSNTSYHIHGDLFTLVTPQNPSAPTTAKGCVFDALVSLALETWAWKRAVEEMADRLLVARCSKRRQELESPGRNIRHVRQALAGTGWTVLDERGRVCLCREVCVAEMRRQLEELDEVRE